MSQNKCVEIHFTLTTPDIVFVNKIVFFFPSKRKMYRVSRWTHCVMPPFMCNYLRSSGNTRRQFFGLENTQATQKRQKRRTNVPYKLFHFTKMKKKKTEKQDGRRQKTKPNERTNEQNIQTTFHHFTIDLSHIFFISFIYSFVIMI